MNSRIYASLFLSTTLLAAPVIAQNTDGPNPAQAASASAEHKSSGENPGRLVAVEGDSPGYKDIRVSDRSPSMTGQTGLWRINSAKTGVGGYFDLGLHSRYFFGDDFIIRGSHDSAAYGVLSFGYTFNEYIEASLSGLIAANENSSMNPRTLFSSGDLGANLKLSMPVSMLAFGVDMGLFFPSGRDTIGPELDNFSAKIVGLATLDLWEHNDIPLRLHLNAGYRYQNRGSGNQRLLTGNVGHLLALTFEYTWFDQIVYGFGAEAPLPYVTPFIEVSGEYALGDGLGFGDSIMRLSPGVRLTPGRGLAFDLGADITVLGGSRLIEGLATPTPWMIHAGLSYNFSPFVAETRVEIREVEKRIEVDKPLGFIAGLVRDAETGKPVANAVISFVDRDGPRILSDADGQYRSYGLKPGVISLAVSHHDYKPGTGRAVIALRDTVPLNINLVAEAKFGVLRGVIVDEKDNSIPATMIFRDKSGKEERFEQDGGSYRLELAPGQYQVQIQAKGFLQQGRGIFIAKKNASIEDFVLKKVPRKRVTILRTDRIEIKSTIYFEFSKARILAKSYHILDEVVDIMLKNPQVKNVRVEGHTDNVGDANYNRQLSQERAQAVVTYLIEHGVGRERLQAMGYGEDRAIATNKTKKGRAQNRRVEFNIVDAKDHPAAAKQNAPDPAKNSGQDDEVPTFGE